MSGETDLATMLASLEPILDPRVFVFASVPGLSMAEAAKLDPIGLFHEQEGLTVIIEPDALPSPTDEARFSMISLSVHSSLEAVGLTAAFATQLGERGISANVIAGAFHDHIFVPTDRAKDAMDALRALAAGDRS